MMDSEKQKVLKVEEVLKKDVIGQDEAIRTDGQNDENDGRSSRETTHADDE